MSVEVFVMNVRKAVVARGNPWAFATMFCVCVGFAYLLSWAGYLWVGTAIWCGALIGFTATLVFRSDKLLLGVAGNIFCGLVGAIWASLRNFAYGIYPSEHGFYLLMMAIPIFFAALIIPGLFVGALSLVYQKILKTG